MENKDFEKIIREKLQHLESDFNPTHWEAMEHRLNTEAAPEGNMREQDSLDELVSDKLRNLEVSFAPGHWEAMEQQLDAAFSSPEVEDVYLDGVAYDNLSNLNSPYNPDHWALMSKRLDEVFSLRHNVHKYKIIEAALLLFLIFTILPYLPSSSNTQQQNAHSIASILPIDSEVGNEGSSDQTIENNILPTQAKESQAADFEKAEATPQNQAKDSNKQVDGAGTTVPPFSSPVDETQNEQISGVHSSLTSPIDQIGLKASMPEASSLQSTILVNPFHLSLFDPIESKSMNLEEEEIEMLSGTFHLLQPKATRIRLGMMASFNVNYIMTPYNDQFSSPAYNHFATGYGGGISLGFGAEQWEVEVGLLYSSISYSPKPNIEINGTLGGGYYGEVLKTATLETIKIPVNIHRSLGKLGKWQTSMLFGATANTALFTNYEFKKVPASTDPSVPPSPVPTGLSARPETHEGFLQGRSLLENTYLTANIGLRVERDLSARWSVFIQPIYQHHLFSTTLGPNRDKINSGSLLFGMRANLKR